MGIWTEGTNETERVKEDSFGLLQRTGVQGEGGRRKTGWHPERIHRGGESWHSLFERKGTVRGGVGYRNGVELLYQMLSG